MRAGDPTGAVGEALRTKYSNLDDNNGSGSDEWGRHYIRLNICLESTII